jgi:hypothetical protein
LSGAARARGRPCRYPQKPFISLWKTIPPRQQTIGAQGFSGRVQSVILFPMASRDCYPAGPPATGHRRAGTRRCSPRPSSSGSGSRSRANASAWAGCRVSAAGLQPCSRMNCSMPRPIGFPALRRSFSPCQKFPCRYEMPLLRLGIEQGHLVAQRRIAHCDVNRLQRATCYLRHPVRRP